MISSPVIEAAVSSPRKIPDARSHPSGIGRRYCTVSFKAIQGRNKTLNTMKQDGAYLRVKAAIARMKAAKKIAPTMRTQTMIPSAIPKLISWIHPEKACKL